MSDEFQEITAEFVTEAEESLDAIDPLFVELETRGFDKEMLNEIFRSMHTIKGAAGFLGFQQVVDVAHRSENILKKLRDEEITLTSPLMTVILESVDMLRALLKHVQRGDGGSENIAPLLGRLDQALEDSRPEGMIVKGVSDAPKDNSRIESREEQALPTDMKNPTHELEPAGGTEKSGPTEKTAAAPAAELLQTLRVDTEKIDKVMNLTGEVVLVRNRLLNIVNYLSQTYPDDAQVGNLFETVSFLDLVTSDMQLSVMRMRMQPIKKVFSKFPRLVRDLAAAMGKEVELKISGEETEVDKSVVENISDPLVHIIRNAMDHGIESLEARRLANKPDRGTIAIEAQQKGNKIVITVSDDGKGIDVARVKRKALQKGLISEEEASRMTDEAATNLIFLPGFSTHEVATEISGRGVGMDVVKTNISKLNGYVEVTSTLGAGSSFVINIPLTLAIIETLMVRAGQLRYAIPLGPVEEITRIDPTSVHNVIGRQVVKIRDKVYPIYDLSYVLGHSQEGSRKQYAVVVSLGAARFCLAVDELLGQEEVVIKNIEGLNTTASAILGATITGDGKVVLILELGNILRKAKSSTAA